LSIPPTIMLLMRRAIPLVIRGSTLLLPQRASSTSSSSSAPSSLIAGAISILHTAEPHRKAEQTQILCDAWRRGAMPLDEPESTRAADWPVSAIPDTPALPDAPTLVRYVPDHKKRSYTDCTNNKLAVPCHVMLDRYQCAWHLREISWHATLDNSGIV
jgi:hypothetical protein